jgi:glutathione synthase/RimK-type ligase-like ATP-grasp enzyme
VLILTISDRYEDPHASAVQSALRRRGIANEIFDPSAFPLGCAITFDASQGGYDASIRVGTGELKISEVRAVWYRKPNEFDLPAGLTPEEDAWIRQECSHFIRGVWTQGNATWVSDPTAIRQASLKLYQLRVACDLGFKIPDTIVTNDVSAARSFLGAHRHGVVAKALAAPYLCDPNRGAATLYTHLVGDADLAAVPAVANGPTLLQEFIIKRADIRVTVIGTSVYAVALDTTEFPEARTDFRRAPIFDIPHAPVALPARLEEACIRLVTMLGLRFGAIDLLQTATDDYVFLEINPNGQWLWLEWATGLQLTSALCDLLLTVAAEPGTALRRSGRRPARASPSIASEADPREGQEAAKAAHPADARTKSVTIPLGPQIVQHPQSRNPTLGKDLARGHEVHAAVATGVRIQRSGTQLAAHFGDVDGLSKNGSPVARQDEIA